MSTFQIIQLFNNASDIHETCFWIADHSQYTYEYLLNWYDNL